MLVTTGNVIEGKTIVEYKGIVRGTCIRLPSLSQGIFGAVKGMLGGNISNYKSFCELARQQAYDDMVANAKTLLANAIVAIRYDTSDLANNGLQAMEIVCYGTAVVVQ
jgi:uncharacterized protein YbjQ (UPF0145 family)